MERRRRPFPSSPESPRSTTPALCVIHFRVSKQIPHYKTIWEGFAGADRAPAMLLEHEETGMEVVVVDADDSESFFCYSMRTLPESSDGVFHILEHVTLSGSGRYPARDAFALLDSRSCNTYMNAMTCPDRTLYPAASPVAKDFDNMFALYSDCVFNPLLREADFLAEGIKVEKSGFGGVVFNEMRGDSLQTESVMARHCQRDLFPGTPWYFSSGGDVEEIPDLTYEKFKATWAKFYHPSNCRLFIYGKEAKAEEKLLWLHETYLKGKGRGFRAEAPGKIERWTEPRSGRYESEDDGMGGSVMLSFLTDGVSWNPYDTLLASVVVDALLGGPSNPLYSAILSWDVCQDLSDLSGMSSDFGAVPFCVGLVGVAEKDRAKAEKLLMDEITRIARDGIGHDYVEASVRRQEFVLQEVQGGIPNGLRMFLKLIRGWERGVMPDEALDVKGRLERLRRELEENPRLLEDWMERNLVRNPHRLSVYVSPTAGTAEAEAARLAVKLAMTIAKRGESPKLEEPPEECPMPRLDLSDIPEKDTETLMEDLGGGIVFQGEKSPGVDYITLAWDLSDLSSEELLSAIVLSRYSSIAGLEGDSDSSSIHRKLRLATGGHYAYVETGRAADGSVRAFYAVRAKCLSRDVPEAVVLLKDWVLRLDRTDAKAAGNAISDLVTDYADYIEQSGSGFAGSVAASPLTPSCRLGEDLMGISAWESLSKMKIEDALSGISSVMDKFSNRERLTIHLAGCPEDKEVMKKAAEFFLDGLSSTPCDNSGTWRSAGGPGKVFYALKSTVAYNAISMPTSPFSTREQEAEAVFAHILSSTDLWDVMRREAGAYGAEASLDSMEEVLSITSYRDPRIAGSFSAMAKAASELEITPEAVSDAKVTRCGRMLKPMAPSAKATLGLRRLMYRITDEGRAERRAIMRSVTPEEVAEAKKRIVAALPSAARATLGPEALFRKDGDKSMEKRKLPKG